MDQERQSYTNSGDDVSNKFYPPGETRGRKGHIDEYPDVVGEGRRAEKGLSPPTKREVQTTYPMIEGAVDTQRRAADRALAKMKWKPPVDPKPGVPISEYPRIVVEGRYDDPKKPIKVPPVLNEDGSVWEPPVDRPANKAPLSTYPHIRPGSKIGKVKRYVPLSPRSHPGYYAGRTNSVPESHRLHYKNCLGLTGEGVRSLLDYDQRAGTLTWRAGSGPRSLIEVPKNPNLMVIMGGFGRNIYGVIFLIMLDRLPTGWVVPADGNHFNWSWENIGPSADRVC